MIQTDIHEQIKQAMRDKDVVRLNVLRGLITAFTNELVAKKRKPTDPLPDEEALDLIRRGVKQRKDSIGQFEKGGRADLADAEEAELAILETLLPAQMSKEEILTFVKAKQVELGATDKSKMGQFMGSVMKDLKGKADSGDVKVAIESLFS
ncbi:MAG: hypothetical protein AB200_00720 [Parcubacteria bacterium C7867-005]|nr:MAG: hypothetical protein AB200_00720 [Parcubacteria bacterium C7867-005]